MILEISSKSILFIVSERILNALIKCIIFISNRIRYLRCSYILVIAPFIAQSNKPSHLLGIMVAWYPGAINICRLGSLWRVSCVPHKFVKQAINMPRLLLSCSPRAMRHFDWRTLDSCQLEWRHYLAKATDHTHIILSSRVDIHVNGFERFVLVTDAAIVCHCVIQFWHLYTDVLRFIVA